MITTIETRLRLDTTQASEIDACVVIWSSCYRKVWKLWNNKKLSETEIYHQLMSLNLSLPSVKPRHSCRGYKLGFVFNRVVDSNLIVMLNCC